MCLRLGLAAGDRRQRRDGERDRSDAEGTSHLPSVTRTSGAFHPRPDAMLGGCRRSARAETAEQMARAADSWLSSLGDAERAVAQRAFPSDDDRRQWFYTPTDHGGLALGAMSPSRQQGALRLLATGLSVAGYNTVATIIGLENILDAKEGWRQVFDRERGRDPGMYYVRVFGEPGPNATWAWRFGGHHVSINHLVVDGEAVAIDTVLHGSRSGVVTAPRPAPAAPARRGRGSRA